MPLFLSWPLNGFFQKRWRVAKGCHNVECVSNQVVGGSQITPGASGARPAVESAWRRSPDHINVADNCVVPCGDVTAVGGVRARVEVDGDDFPAQSGKGSADAPRATEEFQDPWHLSSACDFLHWPRSNHGCCNWSQRLAYSVDPVAYGNALLEQMDSFLHTT